MIAEPDAGNPHVRFDEGVQETCFTRRACALLYPSTAGMTLTCQESRREVRHSVRATPSEQKTSVIPDRFPATPITTWPLASVSRRVALARGASQLVLARPTTNA